MVYPNHSPKDSHRDSCKSELESIVITRNLVLPIDDDGCIYRRSILRNKFIGYWRVLLAASLLLLVGIILIIVGIMVTINPQRGFQNYVFLITGAICFIPGGNYLTKVQSKSI